MSKYSQISGDIRPHDYQLESLEKIEEFLREGKDDSFLVNYPMGGGKSHLISLVSNVEDTSVLVVTPSIEVKKQLRRQAETFKLSYGLSNKEFVYIEEFNFEFRENEKVIYTTFQGLFTLYKKRRPQYDLLCSKIGFVLIDEGHREPSSQWSYVTRKIKKPKLLFTATPYRNDFNIFEIEESNVDIQTYHSLIDRKFKNKYLLREIEFIDGEWESGNEEAFLNQFYSEFIEICKDGLKAIIRCGDSDTIRRLVEKLNVEFNVKAAGIHSTFKKKDNTKNLFNSYYDIDEQRIKEYRVLVHQYKLVEGVDNKSFVFLAFYDEFSSTRALVQQVGRILRYKTKRKGYVLSPSTGHSYRMWRNYLEFDFELDKEKKLWGLKKFASEYTEHINSIVYENTQFKETLDLVSLDEGIINHLQFNPSVNIFKCNESFSFEEAVDLFEADFADVHKVSRLYLEDVSDFITNTNIEKMYLVLFIEVKNSKVLNDIFFPELEIGLAGIFKFEDTLFFYTSGRKSIPTLIESRVISSIPSKKIESLYGKEPIFTNISLSNLDVSDTAIRQRSLRSSDLSKSMSSNMDYSFFVNNSVYRENKKRKYLGVSSSKYTIYGQRRKCINEFVDWLDVTKNVLDKEVEHNSSFFQRFAEVVEPVPHDSKPKYILLDLYQTEDLLKDELDEDVKLFFLDKLEKAFEVNEEKSKFFFVINIHEVNYRITIIRIKGEKFKLSVKLADSEVELEREKSKEEKSILEMIQIANRRQLFRIVFDNTDIIYANKKYLRANNLDVLSEIVYVEPKLGVDLTEKGESLVRRRNTSKWEDSIFKLVSDYFHSKGSCTVLHREMGELDYIVCDDRSSEIADFILLRNCGDDKKIVHIHCKSSIGKKKSAGSLYDVTSQVVKNLQFMNPLFDLRSLGPDRFSGHRTLYKDDPNKNYKVKRIQGRAGLPKKHEKVIEMYEALVKNPNTIKEVWVLIGGGIDGASFKDTFSGDSLNEPYYVTQAKYILLSTWASVSTASARFKVFC